jgi:mono/diheme cytochrome c family protein
MSKLTRTAFILVGLCVVAGLAALPFAMRSNADETGNPARGHKIALDNCSRCHAVEPGKQSPLSAAPPFYTFAQHWPLEDLEESLAEGIMVGHEGAQMPVFQFQPQEIADLIAYLRTIQVPASKSNPNQ